MTTLGTRQLIRAIEAEIAQTTGRRYAIDWAGLDEKTLQEVLRMLRDLEAERRLAVNNARRMPWRRF